MDIFSIFFNKKCLFLCHQDCNPYLEFKTNSKGYTKNLTHQLQLIEKNKRKHTEKATKECRSQ